MKNLALKLATVSLSVLACVSAARAGFNQYSIGLNFGSSDGNNNNNGRVRALADGDVAGLPAIQQPFWNNMAGATGFTNSVVNNSGGSISVGVTWNSPLGTWSSGANTANFYSTNTPNNILAMGYLDNGTTTTVAITNLPSNFTANGYDVYVYTFFDTPNRGGTYTIVDAFNTSTVLSPAQFENSDANPTNYVQYPQTGNTNLSGNYLVFHGLTNPNIQLVAVANHGGTLRAPIAGIQVVAAPAPGEAGQVTGLAVSTNVIGQITLSWTPGSGSAGSIVLMRAGFPATAEPVDGVTYTANSTFGSGDNLGDDNLGSGNFVVFAGAGSSVSVNNVFASANYYFAVYSFTGSGGSTDYTLATPPVTNAIPNGTITNLTLIPPSVPVVAGSARTVKALASFDDGGVLDVSASATFTSSVPAVLSIVSPGRVAAVTNGTATLAAIYKGFTNSQSVTVTSLSLTHRYSFNEALASTNATDSVAGADGIVVSTGSSGMDGAGQVLLSGGGGTSGSAVDFVQLPNDLFTNYGALTLELWATDNGTSENWERFVDYGVSVNGVGSRYLFFTPWVGNGAQLRAAITVGAGEQQVNFLAPPAPGSEHQFVLTINGATRTGALYVDGVRQGVNTNLTLTPEDIGSGAHTWLGRSLFNVDNLFAGTFNEVRIYNGSLDPFQIAVDSSAGPDTPNSSPGNLTNLVLSVPLNPVPQFQVQQASVLGYFDGLNSPIELSTSGKLVYSTSDPNVATIDANGQVTATGAGNATLRAVWPSLKTNSLVLTVTPIPPGITHRWSFNGDFSDSAGGGSYTAVPHGNALISGNQVALDGSGPGGATTGTYVELPPNLLLGYSSIALEMWYTDQDGDGSGVNRNWARLWDFGSAPGNNLFLTPFVGGEVDTMRCALNINNAGEWTMNTVRPLTNVEHHAVFVEDGSNNVAYLYIDGRLAAQNRDFQVRPRDMGPTQNNWLGRSQYGDPLFVGSIDEFRIYFGTIDPLKVGIDFAAGPDTIVSSPGSLLSVSVALTTNMVAGNIQSADALATFTGIANVPVTAASPTWSSSDPTVAKVDSYGRVTAVGPGTASISATYQSVTGNATVIVAAAIPPALVHRYSFNANGDTSDSVGGANGTIVGTAVITNGMLNIIDSSGWVSLPGHLFDTNQEVTLETWCVVGGSSGSGSRMFDSGTSVDSNPSATAPSAFAIAPTANGNNFISFRQSYNNNIGTVSINSWGRPAFGTTNHYAFVISDVNRRMDMYLNGVLIDSFPYNTQPDQLFMGANAQFPKMLGYQYTNMTEAWFGKQVGSGAASTSGSGWRGSIDEFRIWSGAMNKLQAQVSFQKGQNNPSIDPGAIQTLSVALSDSTMVLGSLQRPAVSATFANTSGNVDLTGLPGVVFTSDNSSAVAVVANGSDNKLKAAGVGSAHVVVSYSGLSKTNTVTVIAKPALVLTHRFRFNGDTKDSIGGGSATLFGVTAVANNKLVLNGTSNPPNYARLPSDLIGGYDLATFEAFYSASAGSANSQQRLWDFGDHLLANGGITGDGYLYLAPGRGASGLPNATPGAAESAAVAPSANRTAYTTNTTHVAVTVDSINHILSLYTNGVFSISVTNPVIDLALVVDNFSFLGRSQFADPAFNGSIDEFRLYYGLMTPSQVSASFAAGADTERLTVTISGDNVVVSWPTLLTEGYSLQYSLSLTPVNWLPAGAPTVVGGNNQVTIPLTNSSSFFRLTK